LVQDSAPYLKPERHGAIVAHFARDGFAIAYEA
jgi:hypothetical protein